MQENLKYVLTTVFVIISLSFCFSQSSFKINGAVVDAETGEYLPGATVAVEGTTVGSVTDLKGHFTLHYNKSNFNLVISFISYEPKVLPIDITVGHTKDITVKLNKVSTLIDEVQIVGETEGQVKAMLNQKNAANIKNIVSSEQIEQFPDMNAAEVVQRIPGITLQRDQGEGRFVQLRGTPPELTNFSINGEQIPSPEGNVRYVGLDVISADQIETIEVTKVMTPDMDGDGIGGNVNIVTKMASGKKPDIKVSAAGGYNNLKQTDNYQFQFAFGQRTGKFGFNVNSNYYVNNQGSDNMEFKYVKSTFWGSTDEGVDNYHVQYREYQLRHYDITRQRIGLSSTCDYKFNDKSYIYVRGMYNSFKDDELRRRVVYDLDDAVSEDYYLYGGINRDVRDRIKIQDITSVNLGGEHDLNWISIDYEGAYAIAKEKQPERIEASFDNPGQAITMKINKNDPDWPVIYFPEPTDSTNATNYDEYELDDILFEESEIIDNNVTVKLNMKIPYKIGNSNGYFKYGGKYRTKEKVRDAQANIYDAYFTTSRTYPGEGPEISLTDFDDGFVESNLLNHDYTIDHIPDPGKVRDFFDFYSQFFILDRTDTKKHSYGTDYKANEDIYAVYGMVRHDIDRLMILGGLRYEKTMIDYEGRRVVVDFRNNFQELDTLGDSREHEFLLPNLQMKYSLNNNTNFRLSYTKTYSRPNFEDILPYRDEDDKEITYGNPDLKYPASSNFDLLAERYISQGGIFSGGVFYKNIEDFVFYYKRFGREGEHTGSFSPREITKAINGKRAEVYGAEIQGQFKLSFFPGFISNFGVYSNYTYTYSEAFINKRIPVNSLTSIIIFGQDSLGTFTIEDEEEKIQLPGQAKHTANIALFYDSKRFYAKLTANYHDSFLKSLGADKDLDEYYNEAWHLDFTAHYLVTPHLTIFTDIINLTNSPLKYYLGTPDRLLQQEYYSWWARIGLKLEFN